MRPARSLPGLLVAALLAVACARDVPEAKSPAAWIEDGRPVYGGIPARLHVRVDPLGEAAARAAIDAAWAEIERVGRVVSAFDPASDVGRLNARAKRGETPSRLDLIHSSRSRLISSSSSLVHSLGGRLSLS